MGFYSYPGGSHVGNVVLATTTILGVSSAQMLETKLQANESLATTIGYNDLLYFEPYSPTPSPTSCYDECPCSFPGDPVSICDCGVETVCGGTIPIHLSSGNELSFRWEASSTDDRKYISVTGKERTRVEFQGLLKNCEAQFQDIGGGDITFELDAAGLDQVSKKYTYRAEDSFLSLGTCDGCAKECEIYLRMQFDPDMNGELDMKFKSLNVVAKYDPSKVAQGTKAYEWATNSYIWIRKPEEGAITVLETATDMSTMPTAMAPSDGTTSTSATTAGTTSSATTAVADGSPPEMSDAPSKAPTAATLAPSMPENSTDTMSGSPTESPTLPSSASRGYSMGMNLHLALSIIFICGYMFLFPI